MKKITHRILYFLIPYFLFLIPYFSAAQWYDPLKVNTKATDMYLQSIAKAQNGDVSAAIKMVNDALKIEPKFVDAYISLAGMYAEQKNYNESVNQYNKAFSLDNTYSKTSLLPYSISLAGAGKFDKALEAVNTFLAIPKLNERSIKAGEFRKRTYQFAIDYDKNHGAGNYVFKPQNAGDINSIDPEYYPSLTIDGKKIVFTRRVHGSDGKGKQIVGNEDFYESEFINGKWNEAKALEGNINSPQYNEGAQNISQDGQWLIFTGCLFPEGMGSCDLYISYLTKQGWSKPENLGRNVNSEFWETSPSLSPDKKDLYFTSSVPGGFGGDDIWVCHRSANGKWGPAQNLGPEINSPGNERSPFIHSDNQTLYFNSTGQPGYSEKADLFVARKQPDGKWSKPENLGYPINTIDEETSLIVSSDGKTAFYASDRTDSKGGLDIYTFELREDVRPAKTLWVKGKVFDKKTKEGLPSSVELTDIVSKQPISRLQTDEDGNYLVTLPVGKDYAFNVNRKGYLFYSENFSLAKNAPDSVYHIDIPLQPIEANASIILKNVFFDTKQTQLKPESITELDNVVLLMNENPKLKIQIGGHTDNVGKPADNVKLSLGRAVSVVNYLLGKGIKNDRLTFKGFGETKPIADNNSEQGRALNRRTELIVISN
ncbi:MAG TPA: OmpA family protein [Chitinophagaceae bacterium]|nr:OmpA family protein [Chitinophagaceae bacterium]